MHRWQEGLSLFGRIFHTAPSPCRSEHARDEPENAAGHQTPHVIVDDHREQARSHRGYVADSDQCLATRSLGSLKVQSMPPWLKSFTRLATSPPHSGTAPPQPESTETYCSPSISQVTGEPTMPEPVLNS